MTIQLCHQEEMNVMDLGDEYNDEPISTEMLEDIRDGSKSHLRVNRKNARYKICDCIKRSQAEWK